MTAHISAVMVIHLECNNIVTIVKRKKSMCSRNLFFIQTYKVGLYTPMFLKTFLLFQYNTLKFP